MFRIGWRTHLTGAVVECIFEEPAVLEAAEVPEEIEEVEELATTPWTKHATLVRSPDISLENVQENDQQECKPSFLAGHDHELLPSLVSTLLGIKTVPDMSQDPFDYYLHNINVPEGHPHGDTISTLATLQLQLCALGYSEATEGIHSPQGIAFYRNILQCNPATLDLLNFGYKPHFHTAPADSYRENNNASTLAHMPFVRYNMLLYI